MDKRKLTAENGRPIADNQNIQTAGERGPVLLQDPWYTEKIAHFDRVVIPERRMHAKGSGAFGTFTVTNDITEFTRASIFSAVGKKTECLVRFSTVAGERGAADAERDIRGFAIKFYTDEGNWDLVGNNTPVFFLRDPLKFPDLNHAIKRDPRTGMRNPTNNWDFWTRLRKPYIQFLQPRKQTHMGQIPLQDTARHQEPYRQRSRGSNSQRPRVEPARPLRGHRARRLSPLAAAGAADDRRGGQKIPYQSIRPNKGMVSQRFPASRCGHSRTEPQPGELLRRNRASGVQSYEHS